ncbi:MAG: FKBP-type peptidyl-prolyl cis-trans isomerase [Desulfohalobiaceae bacterium]
MQTRRTLFVTALFFCLAAPALATDPSLNTKRSRVSYSLGVELGRSLQESASPYELDPGVVARGLQDALSGKKPLMDEKDMEEALAEFREIVASRQQEQRRQLSQANLEQGTAFLEANAEKQDVVQLPSGLQYQVLQKGDGPTPGLDQTVTVHYRGTLLDGTVFDSSYERGQPATFPLKGIIKGWQEALKRMPKGSKWRLFIPPDLAYGEQQAGPHIGPNSVLIFDVELLGIEG